MADATPSPTPRKFGFNANIWIADENGNIYYIVRDPKDPNKLQGTRVATSNEKWDFWSRDELVKANILPATGAPDASVAAVKMLLAMGVATAAIPKGIVVSDNLRMEAMSYVINLASFDKANVFWPDDSIGSTRVDLKPRK
jgi:hypothetical protein